MDFDLTILKDPDAVARLTTNTWRPHAFNKRGLAINRQGDLITNAFLNQEEWERLDAAIIRTAARKFNAYSTIVGAGLTTRTTLAEWSSKWRVASEMTAADVTLDFETQVEGDRVDRKTYSVPVPIISKPFSIGRRELLTARANGADLETTNAEEATASVVEQAEGMLINGDTSIVIEGTSISGLRTLTARYTTTADGDFGTIANIYPTFRKLINTMHTRTYHGPFAVQMAPNQYSELLQYYSDGTGQRALDRVLALPEIQSVNYNDLMTDAEFTAVQLTNNVVDIRIALDLETRRWEAPDGSRIYFMVMMAAVPRLKTDYAGYSGIVHITAC